MIVEKTNNSMNLGKQYMNKMRSSVKGRKS